jgi:hypothetical protein
VLLGPIWDLWRDRNLACQLACYQAASNGVRGANRVALLPFLRSLARSAAATAPRIAARPPCPPRPGGGVRGPGNAAGFVLDVFHHVDQHLGRAQIGTRRFVDHLRHDRFALGDLAAAPIDRHDDRLIQRIGQQCRQALGAAAAGVAGLPLLEAGAQRRPARAHLVAALAVRQQGTSSPFLELAFIASMCYFVNSK